jgi:CubicO group peptidase (beta-lactamase class C family)
MHLSRRSTLLGMGAAFAAQPTFAAVADAIYKSAPEPLGFSPAGLAAHDAEFHGLVDTQKLAGVTTLIARHGRVVHFDAYGKADAATGAPMTHDAIFRIASMTKPIAGVAMMQLWEQGRWKLDDPIHKHIPEFRNLKVKGPNNTLVPLTRAPTMAELMSHSAGFDVSAGYESANLQGGTLQDMIDKLAAMPLAFQPGTDWRYGPSVNIQGYVAEKLSGKSLDVLFQERIFGPLGMEDTGFWMPQAKAPRVVRVHAYRDGKIVPAGAANNVTTTKPRFLSASGGLMSTTTDYYRFAQAVLNGGELDGARILKPATVKLMRTNVLKPGVKVDLYGPSMEGIGFGMDFAIVMDPKAANTAQGQGSFYWGGAFGTWFWIDPANDMVFVGMIQNQNGSTPTGGTPPTRAISYRTAYAALTNPQA